MPHCWRNNARTVACDHIILLVGALEKIEMEVTTLFLIDLVAPCSSTDWQVATIVTGGASRSRQDEPCFCSWAVARRLYDTGAPHRGFDKQSSKGVLSMVHTLGYPGTDLFVLDTLGYVPGYPLEYMPTSLQSSCYNCKISPHTISE